MKLQESIKLMKALADKSRLFIINALYEKPMYVEEISERLDLAASTVSFHLKKLVECGLVSSHKEQYYVVYNLDKAILDKPLKEMVIMDSGNNLEKKIQDDRFDEYRAKVIKTFFQYGKLKKMPTQRKKRLIVLEEMLKAFESDRKYTEKEVNIIIADFNDDFCTIRREMIDERMLDRDRYGKEYWKK